MNIAEMKTDLCPKCAKKVLGKDKMMVILTRKEINYLVNELDCINKRRRQLFTYIGKIYMMLNGKSLEEVDKNWKPRKDVPLKVILNPKNKDKFAQLKK